MNQQITDFTNPYGIIYEIKNLINNKRYIGQTILRLKKRSKWQKESVCNNYKHTPHLINSINKYGFINFKRNILDFGKNQEELNEKEFFYIKKYNTLNRDFGYNIRDGGNNGKLSEETKRKMSNSRSLYHKNNPNIIKGKNNGMYGKNHSKETKEKMSKIRKGKSYEEIYGKKRAKKIKNKIKRTQELKWKNEELRTKISKSLKGRIPWNKNIPHTKITKEKISQSTKGIHNPRYRNDLNFITRKYLIQEYWIKNNYMEQRILDNKQKSINEIAKNNNCSYELISNRMKNFYNIPIRTYSESAKLRHQKEVMHN